jgi:hypothetical protein
MRISKRGGKVERAITKDGNKVVILCRLKVRKLRNWKSYNKISSNHLAGIASAGKQQDGMCVLGEVRGFRYKTNEHIPLGTLMLLKKFFP